MLTGHDSGTKPFSAFGIFHGMEKQQNRLGEAYKSDYPKLESELRKFQTKENRGLLALLLDTLLDLDLIKEKVTRVQPSMPSSNTEGGRDHDHGEEKDKALSTSAGTGVLLRADGEQGV